MTTAATGANVRLRMMREAVYNVAAVGNYNNLPFLSSTLGSAQPLIADALLGQGRDPQIPSRDAITVSGDITAPVDENNFGLWLALLLGDPVSTHAAPHYSHVYKSGAVALPSASIEIGHPGIGQYFLETGCFVNSMEIDMAPGGQAQAKFSLIGTKEIVADASAAGAPTDMVLARYSNFQGIIKRDGDVLGNLTAATLVYTNNATGTQVIGNEGYIQGADFGVAGATGKLTARFTDMDLLNAAINGTPIDLSFGFSVSADQSLNFELPNVFLPKVAVPINGPGAVLLDMDYQSAYDSVSGHMMTATLINALTGDVYRASA